MRSRALLAALLAAAPAVAHAQATSAPAPRDTSTTWGRQYTMWFYTGQVDSIWAQMNAQMREALGGKPDQLRTFADQAPEQVGKETKVIRERVLVQGDYVVYLREVLMEKFADTMLVQWARDKDDRIAGFFIQPKKAVMDGK